ncbi:hypothetical protein FOTG_01494 [Fusarium oxysporum f. sp. vasinfectum 25433]|nr:hypothetical protein FOTG_01494 [Fusarium oxysporum f. sp. vasinfectum 25433]
MILVYTPNSTDPTTKPNFLFPSPTLPQSLPSSSCLWPLLSPPPPSFSLSLNNITNKPLQQIRSCLQTIGDVIMAIIGGIGRIITAIVNGIVAFCSILVRFLTCGYCGSKGGRAKRRGHSHMRTTRV